MEYFVLYLKNSCDVWKQDLYSTEKEAQARFVRLQEDADVEQIEFCN